MNRLTLAGIGLLAALLTPAVPAVAPAVAGGDETLKPSDHQSLGKLLGSYFDAVRKNKSKEKPRADVAAELDKFRKRLKNRDPLSLPVDIGKAYWQSFEYASAKNVKKGKVSDVKFSDPETKIDFTYATWVPVKYEPSKAYPLVLCIPDKGEKPMDHLTEKWTSQEMRENVVLAAVPMPEDPALWSEIGAQGKWGGGANLLTVFREVSQTYATDFDRVYIAGRGAGVAAAMAIAARNADRFAGVIGRSGDPAELPCDNFKNLPTFFQGAGGGATAFADKCTKAGYDNNCTIKPEAKEEDIWAWIKDHPRISFPPKVVLLPGSPSPSRSYWLEIRPWDGQGTAIVKGSIDRATNTVTIEGEGVTSVILHFNDVLVDLEKPVKVVCNGSEHTDVIPRNLGVTLDLISSGRSDAGKIFTASKEFDLPAKPKGK